jgi:hypothetical protein
MRTRWKAEERAEARVRRERSLFALFIRLVGVSHIRHHGNLSMYCRQQCGPAQKYRMRRSGNKAVEKQYMYMYIHTCVVGIQQPRYSSRDTAPEIQQSEQNHKGSAC